MPRNLYERCEVIFPVLQPDLSKRLREEILDTYLKDNVKARLLNQDGSYTRANPESQSICSAQDWFINLAQAQKTPVEIEQA